MIPPPPIPSYPIPCHPSGSTPFAAHGPHVMGSDLSPSGASRARAMMPHGSALACLARMPCLAAAAALALLISHALRFVQQATVRRSHSGTSQRPTSAANLAATEVQHYTPYRGPFLDNHPPGVRDFIPVNTPYDSPLAIRGHALKTPDRVGRPRPWSSRREPEGLHGKEFMSERKYLDHHPLGSSVGEGLQSHHSSTARSQEERGRQWTPGGRPVALSPSLPGTGQSATQGLELPPLPQGSNAMSFAPSSTRLAGVSSILNPISTEESAQSRRRKASEIESPHATGPSLPPLALDHRHSHTPGTSAAEAPRRSYGGLIEGTQRRILTPRSPSLHHSASLGQIAPPTGAISAQRAPFLGSPHQRSHAPDFNVTGSASMPTAPAAAARHMFGFSNPTPPLEMARGASAGAARHANVPSASASPSTSYSSFSQTGQTSPVPRHGSAASYSHAGEGGSGDSRDGQDRQRPVGIPISSSGGQNTYQMMTLETTSGTVQLPVDVQAASRVADEKRRRNAGASARFRQRRKEKEREASTTIARLEQQMKGMSEEADFYRRERDYMASVMLQTPGGDRHFPRPASPRRRRSSTVAASASYSGMQESARRSPEENRHVRRRTSTLPPPPTALQSAIPPRSGPLHPGYDPQLYGGTHIAPQPPSQMQALTAQHLQPPHARGAMPPPTALPPMQQAQAPGLPPLMQASPQTGPWNPYAPERRPSAPHARPKEPR